jgi:hypothetical protein
MTGRADVPESSGFWMGFRSRLPWDGSAIDGVAKQIMATAKTGQQKRIVILG